MAFRVVNGMRTIEFGNPGASRQKLVDLVIHGNKRATAGLYSEYLSEGEPIEQVGERLGILDNEARLVAVVEVTRVEKLKFSEVPDEFALAEAEGDLSAEDFRTSHREFWEALGEQITDDTEVVTLYFDLVEVLNSN